MGEREEFLLPLSRARASRGFAARASLANSPASLKLGEERDCSQSTFKKKSPLFLVEKVSKFFCVEISEISVHALVV